MTNMEEMASACVSLKYKYSNMMDCVKGQRPALLGDPVLSSTLLLIESLEKTFEDRVEKLAESYYEHD